MEATFESLREKDYIIMGSLLKTAPGSAGFVDLPHVSAGGMQVK